MAEETALERRRRLARDRKRRQRERQRSGQALLTAKAADTLHGISESVEERQRRLCRERQRRHRERLSATDDTDVLRKRTRLCQEIEYEQKIRRRKEREMIAQRRLNLSQGETEERRRIERERIAQRRDNEIEEAAIISRRKMTENMRRQSLTTGGTRLMGTTTGNVYSTTMSPLDPSSQPAFLFQPTDDKLWEITRSGNKFENQGFVENTDQKSMIHSAQPFLAMGTQMPVQQHLQVSAEHHSPAQPVQKQAQMLKPHIQVAMPKSKPLQIPQLKQKRLLAVANHQQGVMSNMASLWKSGKLCDAGIGNGSSTVKVHKLVLSAVCPKLLSMSNTDKLSHKFLQVNFPCEVSTEALNAFAEYMYKGILDLDHDILEQLKIIAKRLDMEEFEKLCNSHLPTSTHQPSTTVAAASAASFANISLIQTSISNPVMTPSLTSHSSTDFTSEHSYNDPVFDIKQEVCEDELTQVHKDMATMFCPESDLPSLASNISGNADSFVLSPCIKTEPIRPDEEKYGHWNGNKTKAFTSNTQSSSNVLVPVSSTGFTIPFSEVKSIKIKAPTSHKVPFTSDLSPVSGIMEMVHPKSNSITTDSSKPLGQTLDSLSCVKLSDNKNAVCPVELFNAKGGNLSSSTMHSSDTMTVNSLVLSEET